MDPSLKAQLIREGNQAFNTKDFQKAKKLFVQTRYQSGLIRIGDYYMYDKRLPLLAYGYYKLAGAKAKIEDLHRRMVTALAQWLGLDKIRPEYQEQLSSQKKKAEYTVDQTGMIPVPVSPLLRGKAKAILGKSKSS